MTAAISSLDFRFSPGILAEYSPETGIVGHLGRLHHKPNPFGSEVIFQHFLKIDVVVMTMHGNGFATQYHLMAFAAKFIPSFNSCMIASRQRFS